MMTMIKSGALLLFLFALLTTVLHVQSSSTSNSLPLNNITIGSSIYASSSSSSNQTSNSSSYWLSPSGVFAFGFYPLCYNCSEYKVAIWINRPSNKVVVWSNNDINNEPIYAGSSIQLSHDGVFTIHQLVADSTTTKPLFNHTCLGPATYALMQDTGNFVVYNYNNSADSNIIVWQSFDYPTDTILPGQTLKPDKRLVVSHSPHKYKLIMQNYGNLELIEIRYHSLTGEPWEKIKWESKTGKKGGGMVLSLDSTGRMYLVDNDGIIIKKLTKGKKQNQGSIIDHKTTIYRATLLSDGVFRMYAERIGLPITHDDSIVLWESYCKSCEHRKNVIQFVFVLAGVIFTLVVWGWARFRY